MNAVVQLDQNTDAWMNHRRVHCNASSAGLIMGVQTFTPNTWDSLLNWYRGKGVPFVGNVATDWGHTHEDEARVAAEKLNDEFYAPVVVSREHKGLPLSASLDGKSVEFDGTTGHVAEIKCPYQGKQSKTWLLVEKGECPPQYYWQIQQQMFVADATEAMLFIYDARDKSHLQISVPRNDSDIELLIEKWAEFWSLLESGEMKGDGVLQREDSAFERVAVEWSEANTLLAEAKQRVDAARATLIDLSGDRDCEGFGVRVTQAERKGNINYKSVPSLDGVDLEEYRGKSSSYFRVAATK
jgi:putative phage-type endonuclease|tara:strand:- start:2601 stop:3494 length:894 start_codon:yes stop_codon:yes gene_type:complete